MSSGRQVAANRANAQKSTGPRTAAGKARASGNARRHGLTAAPEWQAVARWYRIILDDPGAAPDPLDLDSFRRAARDLAEAEAQLERVRRAEEDYFRDPEGPPGEAEEEMQREREMIRSGLEEIAMERAFLDPGRRVTIGAAQTPRQYERWQSKGEKLLSRARALEQRARNKRLKTRAELGRALARYRASAEARRHKALRRWIEEKTKRSQSRT